MAVLNKRWNKDKPYRISPLNCPWMLNTPSSSKLDKRKTFLVGTSVGPANLQSYLCDARRMTLPAMDLLAVWANGFVVLLNSTHFETEVFFVPSYPALGLHLFGTVCLTLPSGNKIDETHQYRNLFTPLQNKAFYLRLGFWRRISCASKSQCSCSFYWFQQYLWVLSSFVLLADWVCMG